MAVETQEPPRRPPLRAVEVRPRERPRELPHSDDAEASILGGIFVRSATFESVRDIDVDDFYNPKHRVVWQAMHRLAARSAPIDVVTVESEIEQHDREFDTNKLEMIGGIAFLGELALRVPTADNMLAYADLVRLEARNRRAIATLGLALERAYRGAYEPTELVSEVAGELQRFVDMNKPPPKRLGLISIEQSLADLEQLARAPVYTTPFDALNEAIGFGGFLGTQVYTVAAGTGRGKTTWVAHVAAHAAQSVPVLVVSYEMKPGYFVARKAASVLGRHSNDILRGNIPTHTVLAAMPYGRLALMHRPTLAQLGDAAAFVSQKYGAAPLIVVDYIQKLADEIALGQARPDLRVATSQASQTLCNIAERTGAAVIAVSAIGRGKGRTLSSPRKLEPYELVEVAKESGAVEYDGAGLIVLSLSSDFDGSERIATITVAKARFGEECHIDARYHGSRGDWRTLGRVEVAPKIVTKPDDGSRRTAIVQALLKHGVLSKNKIVAITKLNKTAVLSEVDAMVDAKMVVARDGGFALSEAVPEERQTEIGETR